MFTIIIVLSCTWISVLANRKFKKHYIDRIVCAHNEIGGRGLCALAESLRLNCTLTRIFIWGNDLTESASMVCSIIIYSPPSLCIPTSCLFHNYIQGIQTLDIEKVVCFCNTIIVNVYHHLTGVC